MSIALLILLPVLLSGYVFSLAWVGSKYAISREQGYSLYFRSAYYGSAIVVASYYIVLLIIANFHEELLPFDEAFNKIFHEPDSLALYPLMQVAFVSLLIPHPMALILNLCTWRRLRHYFIKVATNGDDMEEFLWAATQETTPIAVSMENRKVYYGFLVSGYDPSQECDYIKMLPLVSGYREREDLNLVFTTFYDDVYEQVENSTVGEDNPDVAPAVNKSTLLLPKSQIQSIGPFDIQLYDQFQLNRKIETGRKSFIPTQRTSLRAP